MVSTLFTSHGSPIIILANILAVVLDDVAVSPKLSVLDEPSLGVTVAVPS